MKIKRVIRFQNDSIKVQEEQVSNESRSNCSSNNDASVIENINIAIPTEASQSDKSINLEEKKGTPEYIEKYFPIVKASTLSLEDEFLKYEPKTDRQEFFKNHLIWTINSGLPDFRAQSMDPYFDEKDNICFKKGKHPAVGKSANWWNVNAKKFMPEKGSRLGIIEERIAFLGLLIKYLIEEENYIERWAWESVCDDSAGLGHYKDSSPDALHWRLESTGRRQVGKWYDLANTWKITKRKVDWESFAFMGGRFEDYGTYYPLANEYRVDYPNRSYEGSVGWIVLPI